MGVVERSVVYLISIYFKIYPIVPYSILRHYHEPIGTIESYTINEGYTVVVIRCYLYSKMRFDRQWVDTLNLYLNV